MKETGCVREGEAEDEIDKEKIWMGYFIPASEAPQRGAAQGADARDPLSHPAHRAAPLCEHRMKSRYGAVKGF